MFRLSMVAASLLAVVCFVAPVDAGNCLGVSTVASHGFAAAGHHVAVLNVPVAAAYTVQPVAVCSSAATTFQALGSACHVGQATQFQATQFQALAVPVVQNQAFVAAKVKTFAVNQHCFSQRQRGFVVDTRVRRERRGLGRLLFGR